MPNLLTHDSNGKFAKGNQAARGNGHPSLQRLVELRAMYMGCVTVEKMQRIENEVFDIATTEQDPRVRLTACVEWLNRVLGKPVESVAIQTDSRATTAVLNISADEQRTLEAIIAKNGPAALPDGD